MLCIAQYNEIKADITLQLKVVFSIADTSYAIGKLD